MTISNEDICDQIDQIRKNDNIMAFERWRAIGEIVRNDLKASGHFFNTEQGLFLFNSELLRAFELRDDEPGLAAILNWRYGINPKEHCYKLVLANLKSEAYLNGRKIDIRRLAHYDREHHLLYVSRFDGHVYRLDGDSIAKVENGADDVFFFDNRVAWEPYEYSANVASGAFDRQLIESVNFADCGLSKDEQRKLLKLWLLSVFFGNIQPTKIILLLLGEHGSGKTSALRRIQKFIFGQKADLLSIDRDKQDGFIATVTSEPVALFDNLDEQIRWLPFALSRLATGVTFAKRVLFTTNDKAEFPGISWLGITSRTVDFMENQPDLPDRTLVLEMERLNDKRPEGELVSEIAQHRNAMWSELLDQLNSIVRHLKTEPQPITVRFRMADFASFALQVATMWGCRKEIQAIFAKLEEAQSELVLEDDPIRQVLDVWLKEPANRDREMLAGSLYREWIKIATAHEIAWSFKGGKHLGQRLRQLRHALNHLYDFKIKSDAHLKQNTYRFAPKAAEEGRAPQMTDADVPLACLENPKAAGYAGCAG